MPKFERQNQKGLSQILILIILVVGLFATLYLSQRVQIFKPKAYDAQPTDVKNTPFCQIPFIIGDRDYPKGVPTNRDKNLTDSEISKYFYASTVNFTNLIFKPEFPFKIKDLAINPKKYQSLPLFLLGGFDLYIDGHETGLLVQLDITSIPYTPTLAARFNIRSTSTYSQITGTSDDNYQASISELKQAMEKIFNLPSNVEFEECVKVDPMIGRKNAIQVVNKDLGINIALDQFGWVDAFMFPSDILAPEVN